VLTTLLDHSSSLHITQSTGLYRSARISVIKEKRKEKEIKETIRTNEQGYTSNEQRGWDCYIIKEI
jgi:hypothetical protein